MTSLLHDFRYGLRLLARYPGFSAIAIGTLIIGIGVNTAIFSAVYTVVFKPLPYEEPDRLVSIWETLEERGMNEVSVSPLNFRDWREQSRSFEEMATARSVRFTMNGGAGPTQVIGAGVSEGFFEMLGIRTEVGSPLRYDADQPTALVSHRFWMNELGGDRSFEGESIRLNDQLVTVVGVLPESFHPPAAMDIADAEVWLPIDHIGEDLTLRGDRFLSVAGRLMNDITLAEAESELRTIAARLAAEYPEDNEGWGVRLVPMQEQVVGPVRGRLVVLLCAVGLILLIACANVAHLVLARSESRKRELAVRKAMGGSRIRIARQIVIENLVLSTLGCVGGIALAAQGAQFLVLFGPPEIPRRAEIGLDWTVVGFACAVAIISALLIAAVPAMRLSGRHSGNVLRESSRSIAGTNRRTTNLIIAAELALALILLVGAGLLVSSLLRLSDVDAGFDPSHLIAARVFVSDEYESDESRIGFFDRVREEIAAIPGIESVAATNNLPFGRNSSAATFTIEGRPELTEHDPVVSWNQTSPGYFATLGVPLRAGRELRESDDAAAPPVVIISESMQRTYWPGRNAVGRRMKLGSESDPWMTVIGVVPDVRHQLHRDQGPTVYVSYRQRPRTGMYLVARTTGDPASFAGAIREAIWSVDEDLPIDELATIASIRRASISETRFYSWLLASFAGIALILAMTGVYGVTSFAVSRRTVEVGVRMALGARAADVVMMIVRQALPPLVAGITIGIAGSLALNRFLGSLLFEIEPTDPATFVTAALLLSGMLLVASLVPAIRAARTQPMNALRTE